MAMILQISYVGALGKYVVLTVSLYKTSYYLLNSSGTIVKTKTELMIAITGTNMLRDKSC